jgi:hypothetical protein
MAISAHILQRAIELYLGLTYPGGTAPAAAKARAEPILALDREAEVPLSLLETDSANSLTSYALRLGQPMYPHMKLVIEPAPQGPGGAGGSGRGYLLRVDSHDRHLHAPAGSPDAVWLASVRASNKELGEKIEAAWAAAGLPTFKEFLRQQLMARKAGGGQGSGG